MDEYSDKKEGYTFTLVYAFTPQHLYIIISINNFFALFIMDSKSNIEMLYLLNEKN